MLPEFVGKVSRGRHAGAFAVAVIVVVSALYMVWRLRLVREWHVMTDELLYVDLARGVAGSGLPLPVVRGEHVDVYGMLYPVLIAPFVGLLSMPDAFGAIHVLNAIAIAGAAVPAYLLARTVTERRSVLLPLAVAAGTVFTPYLAAASKITTEPLAYLVFTWAAYAIVAAVLEPSRRAQLLALLAIVLAYLTRTQFLYLALLYPMIGLLQALRFESGPLTARLRRFWAAQRIAVVAVGALVVSLVVDPGLALGNYAITATGDRGGLLPGGIIHSLIVHTGTLAMQLGGIAVPLAIAFVAGTLVTARDRARHAFALTLLLTGAATIYVTASFDTRFVGALSGIDPSEIVRERYFFYLTPLVLTGLVAFFADLPSWGVRARIAAAAAAFAGALTVTQASLRTDALIPSFDSPGRIFNQVLIGRIEELRPLAGDSVAATTLIALGALGGLLIVGALLWRGRTDVATAVALSVVLAYLGMQAWYVTPRVVFEQNQLAYYLGDRDDAARSWVDRAAGGREVAMLGSDVTARGTKPYFDPYLSGAIWWDAEYWNERIAEYIYFAGQDLTMPPYREADVDFETGRLQMKDAGPLPPLLLTAPKNPLAAPAGARVATRGDLALHESLGGKLAWASRGIYPEGWTNARERAGVAFFGGAARAPLLRVRLLLQAPPGRQSAAVTVFGTAAPKTVDVDDATTVETTVCTLAAGPHWLVILTDRSVDLGDRKQVGVRLASVTTTPAGRC